MATLAPVIASIAMWLITSSPFALMFAFLGPLIAVGSLVDSRLQARRRSRTERARFQAEAAVTRRAITDEHDRIRERMRTASRSSGSLLPASVHDAERWRHSGGALWVVLGSGDAPSGVTLAGDDGPHIDDVAADFAEVTLVDAGGRMRRGHRRARRTGRGMREGELRELLDELRMRAARVDRAPIAVDATFGIGICGPSVLAKAFARAVVMQLADRLSPADFELRGGWERWHERLPHFRHADGPSGRLEFVATPASRRDRFVVVLAATAAELPRECRVGLEVSGGEVRVLRLPRLATDDGDVPAVPEVFRADLVSREEAELFASVLQQAAKSEGLGRSTELPGACRLDGVWDEAPSSAGGLPSAFVVDEDGPVLLDIVRDGPHAVIGGTTGSGKSELLIAWVLSLSRRYGPDEVNLLLVDFKGGASFADVERLPHCVGVVTDLDRDGAERALASLRAEVRHRERTLAERGLRSIDDATSPAVAGMPRLIVVVDEFAAMVGDFPELHSLFSDIAARGRSLGMHLILCTQSPARAVRDSVMANCTLRLSLRVNNAHDSSAVIGTADAAELPQHPVGRCLVSVAGAQPRLVQVAQAAVSDADVVAKRWAGSFPARRPWLPSLPAVVTADILAAAAAQGDVPPGAIAFGVLDRPDSQSQPAAVWIPRQHGTVLAIGGQGSGKTTALAALSAKNSCVWLTGDIERVWDSLVQLTRELWTSTPNIAAILPATVVIDDVDAVVSRCPEPWGTALGEMLTSLLRDGPSAGVRIAMSAQRLTPLVQSLASLCDTRLVLRMPSRQDHVLAGGQGAEFDAAAGAGRGWWRGERVQVAQIEPLRGESVSPGVAVGHTTTDKGAPPRTPLADHAAAGVVVVTNRPAAVAAVLCRLYPGSPVISRLDSVSWSEGINPNGSTTERGFIVADPAAWQGAWMAFSELRSHMPVVFDRCSAAEFRLVSGIASPPPPLSGKPGGAWLLDREGSVARVQMPDGL